MYKVKQGILQAHDYKA